MTSRKPRKSLDDALATEFVYGKPSEPLAAEPEPPVSAAELEPEPEVETGSMLNLKPHLSPRRKKQLALPLQIT
jgi:hypothetical protein